MIWLCRLSWRARSASSESLRTMRESFARDERAMARPVSEGDPGIDVPRSHADSSATGNTRANRWRIETLRSLDRWRSQVTWSALGLAVSAQSTPTQSRLEAFFLRKASGGAGFRHRRLTRQKV